MQKQAKQLLLIMGLLCILQTLQAQKINFNLSSYSLPDYDREQFDFTFNLNGNHQNSDYFSSYQWAPISDKVLTLQNTFMGTYATYSNSASKQKENTISIGLPVNYQKVNTYEQFYFSPFIKSTKVERWFLKRNDFVETNINANVGGIFINQTSRDKIKQTNAFIELPIKYGSGRIEEVQDARQAIYILQELQDNKLLNKPIDDTDIKNLATRISLLKTERYYDSRIHKLKELETIDQFLRENQYIDDNSIRYFGLLNDMWDYGRNQIRKSGKSAALAIYPGIGAIKNTLENGSETLITPSISGGFELNAYKPISLKIQSNTEIKVLGGYMQWKEIDSELKNKLPHARVNFRQSIGIYPTTRTDFIIFIDGSMLNVFESKDENNGTQPEAKMMEINGGIRWNYYISERMRIQINWQLNYIKNDTDYYEGLPINQNLNQNILVSAIENQLNTNYYLSFPIKEEFLIIRN